MFKEIKEHHLRQHRTSEKKKKEVCTSTLSNAFNFNRNRITRGRQQIVTVIHTIEGGISMETNYAQIHGHKEQLQAAK